MNIILPKEEADDLEKKRTLLQIIYRLRKFTKDELFKKYCPAKKTSQSEVFLIDNYLSQLIQINLLLQIGGKYILKSHYHRLNKLDPTE
jgi:hypothetical protein